MLYVHTCCSRMYNIALCTKFKILCREMYINYILIFILMTIVSMCTRLNFQERELLLNFVLLLLNLILLHIDNISLSHLLLAAYMATSSSKTTIGANYVYSSTSFFLFPCIIERMENL